LAGLQGRTEGILRVNKEIILEIQLWIPSRLYWRSHRNTVAADLRSAATVLRWDLQYNLNSTFGNGKDLNKISKRTKIVCTIGPKCCTAEKLKELILAGVDVFRLNFSFGDHDTMREYHKNIQQGGMYVYLANDL
jgi:hypothetical protein